MKLQNSPFTIQNKRLRDLDYAKEYPTFADLMKEQSESNGKETTVHRRRDLDSLG